MFKYILHLLLLLIFSVMPLHAIESSQNSTLSLTQEEQAWLNKHQKVFFSADPNWLPFEAFSENGKYIGIVADHIKILEERSGLQLEKIVPKSWSDVVAIAKVSKLDVISGVLGEKFSDKYKPIKPYLDNNIIIVMHNRETFIKDPETKLLGKKIAIIKDYGYVRELYKKYPELTFVEVANVQEGLNGVVTGKYDAMFGSVALLSYTMQKMGLYQLKIVGDTDVRMHLTLFVKKSEKILYSIISKTMKSISIEEQTKILQAWFKQVDTKNLKRIDTEKNISLLDILPLKTILISLIVLALLLIILFQYLRKKEEVNLGMPIFILISIFLSVTILITVFTIFNLEKVQKREIKDSLTTIVNMTDKALHEWYMSESKSILYMTQHSPYLKNISQLIAHQDDAKYLKENQQSILKYYESIKANFNDNVSYFIVSKNGTIVSASVNELIGSKIKQDFAKQEFKFAFDGHNAFIHSEIDKDDKYKLFTKLYFLTPLYDKNSNEIIAVYATGIKPQKIINITQEGIVGSTGETYLINRRAQLISNSRFDKELQKQGLIKENQKSFLNLNISFDSKPTLAASELLEEKNGFNVDGYKDYRGVNVFGVWKWDKELNFGIITEIDQSEAMSPFENLQNIIYSVVFSIVGFVVLLMAFIVWFANKNKKNLKVKNRELQEFSESLELKVIERTTKIKEQQQQFTSMVSNVPGAIYRVINNPKWPVIYMSDEIQNITGYTPSEFMDGKIVAFSKIMYPEDVGRIGKSIEEQLSKGRTFQVEYRVVRRDGKIVWVRGQGQSITSESGEKWIDGVIIDITKQKELEQELKVSENRMKTLFDAAPDAITILRDGKWIDCNPATLKLFGADNKEDFINRLPSEISPEFQPDGMASMPKVFDAIAKAVELGSYQMEWEHVRLDDGKSFLCDVVLAPIMLDNKMHIYGIIRDITERKILEQKLEDAHKHTRESIEYGSLIQGALIPNNKIFENFFQDYFAIWQPKDIVGGDIYLMHQINEDELVLMVIDCTGHGVPGAFVTMLVKAIERQIMANIHKDKTISPAKILSIFNKSIKNLLKQESTDSVSNAGFDGGIIYYNKKEKIIKFSGAEIALFYVEDEELKTIKGSRQSIGYKTSDASFEFKEHVILVKEGMQFYCTTDGYLDQNGGEKGFPFGKRKFGKLVIHNQNKDFSTQKEIFLHTIAEYQGNEERNDDLTVVGFKI